MRTLVLNAGYEPLSVVSFRRALLLVLAEKATIISADDKKPVRSAQNSLPRPTVIVLNRYVRRPQRMMNHVTRRGVLRRDSYKCAYCDKPATTIDHVIPRCKGGENSWENLVAACFPCNSRKADKTLAQLGWHLRVTPRCPRSNALFLTGLEHMEADWGQYLYAG